MGCGQSGSVIKEESEGDRRRKSVIQPPPPVIPVSVGSNVKLRPPPAPTIIAIFGGPGSHKGRIVANLHSMFGAQLLSVEGTFLEYLPAKVKHTMEIHTCADKAKLVGDDTGHLSLDWALKLMQHSIETNPDQIFLLDLVPSLRWLLRPDQGDKNDESPCPKLSKDCAVSMETFESRYPISFAINLSLGLDSLDQTLDYSHHNAPLPPGATVGDEADNGRAKRRFKRHENASKPFLDYFLASDRLFSVDVSSGAEEPIWDMIHEFFTDNLQLRAWRPVDGILVFAMDGLKAGNLDLSETELQVISLKDVVKEPQGPVEGLLEDLSHHIDSLAASSHYFVIDPTDTSILDKNMGSFHKRSLIFSEVSEKDEGCFNKFSLRLNNLVGGNEPYFKAVYSSEDETLIFPSSTPDDFCQQLALCMALKHPSKRE